MFVVVDMEEITRSNAKSAIFVMLIYVVIEARFSIRIALILLSSILARTLDSTLPISVWWFPKVSTLNKTNYVLADVNDIVVITQLLWML